MSRPSLVPSRPLLVLGQHFVPVVCDQNGVLPLCAQPAVRGHRRPVVLQVAAAGGAGGAVGSRKRHRAIRTLNRRTLPRRLVRGWRSSRSPRRQRACSMLSTRRCSAAQHGGVQLQRSGLGLGNSVARPAPRTPHIFSLVLPSVNIGSMVKVMPGRITPPSLFLRSAAQHSGRAQRSDAGSGSERGMCVGVVGTGGGGEGSTAGSQRQRLAAQHWRRPAFCAGKAPCQRPCTCLKWKTCG